MPELQAGLSATIEKQVTGAMLASEVGSGSVPVLATPELVLLLEQAAVIAISEALPPAQTSVGTQLQLEHLAATPIGMTVTATATLTGVDSRVLTFQVEAYDEVEQIARGTHVRFLVKAERFVQKARQKERAG